MNRMEWTNATTVAEAVSQLGGGAVLKAGGVDLMDLLKEQIVAPTRLVNIRTVRGLERLGEDGDTLHLGPMLTLARLAHDPLVSRRYRALAEAAGHAATPQIRNMATLGGNLAQRPRCWYFRAEQFPCKKKGGTTCFAAEGENAYHAVFANRVCAIVHPSAMGVALVALGARVELTGPTGAREVPVEAFFTLPDADVTRENVLAKNEMITDIRVPAPAAGGASAYIKQGEKESFDWPIAEVAVAIERRGPTCTKASVILGAAAPVPWRAKAVEAALVGKSITEDVARAAARGAREGATPLAHNGYKLDVFEAIVRRTILAAVADERRTP